MALLPNPLSWPWRIGLTILSAAAAAGVGAFYGAIAVYEASYISHIIIAVLAAFLLYGIMRVPHDNDPGFCFFIAALASVCMLGAGWWVTLDFIRSDFPDLTTWQATGAHAEAGVVYQERFYGRSGAWVDRLRTGGWVYLAWLVQAATLPIFLFIGALSGGFRAHTKSTPKENYETALDAIVERNNEAANPFNWEPQGTSVRAISLSQLARDLWHNYSVFFWPVLIVLAVAMLLPESDPKPFIVFWASLFSLQAAAALLTGTQHRMRLDLRAVFDQFFLFARLGGLLILCFIAGFFLVLMPLGFLAMLELTWENMFLHLYGTAVGGLMIFVLIRLWPMMAMHSLFKDVDMRENSGAGMSARILNNHRLRWPGSSRTHGERFAAQHCRRCCCRC